MKDLRATLRGLWLQRAPRHFLRRAHPSRAELGDAGEELAARHLRRLGWRLRGRQLRTAHGEVDLWAWHAQKAWVVEVKTRHVAWHFSGPPRPGGAPRAWSMVYRPSTSLTPKQRSRLARAARDLARRCDRQPALALVEVFVSEDGRTVEVHGPGGCLL